MSIQTYKSIRRHHAQDYKPEHSTPRTRENTSVWLHHPAQSVERAFIASLIVSNHHAIRFGDKNLEYQKEKQTTNFTWLSHYIRRLEIHGTVAWNSVTMLSHELCLSTSGCGNCEGNNRVTWRCWHVLSTCKLSSKFGEYPPQICKYTQKTRTAYRMFHK